ncbi:MULTISPECIES: DUF5318 family protein [unclassified Corynebacterium]|uniref:DUF5318 family protein n=1 Tax=unclassified Corynebacterium TaxID=2624378 RepID=UPI0030A87C5C
MLKWQDEVDHTLVRNNALAQWRAGEIATRSLCDADSRLVAAARFHGQKATHVCPVCRKRDLRLVSWVFGQNLGRRSGTACSQSELEALVAQYGDCTVKQVEVCPDCRWNFIVRTATAVI